MASFTGTTHATWVPDQWANEFRVALEAALVLAKVIKNVPFDDKQKGDVIHIPDVSNYTAADLAESDADITGTANTESEFILTINKKKHISMYFPKHLGGKLSKYDFRAPYEKRIGYGLGKVMDDDIFALFSGLSQAVGTTADGLNGNISDALILAAMEKLDIADVPDDGRRVLVIAARQKSKALAIDKFVRADAVGDSRQLIALDKPRVDQARFIDLYGMPTYYTSQTPIKLAATAPATPVDSHAGLMLHEDALAIAVPQSLDVDFAYIPEKKAWFLSGDVLYGVAEFRDAAGVVVFTKVTG